MPERSAVCPEDRILFGWQEQPDWNLLDPLPNRVRDFRPYWRFTSSYQLAPAAYAEDMRNEYGSPISQYTADHNLFWMGDLPLGRRSFSEIVFPGAKVAWFDFHDRHSAKHEFYHAHEQAASPLTLFDGSVHSIRTSDTNLGFDPKSPTRQAVIYNYDPSILGFEPPTISGNRFDRVTVHYRFTRGGLKGVDFGAGEIYTGQNR